MDRIKKTQSVRKKIVREKNFPGVPIHQAFFLVPGLLVAISLAWLSIFISKYIGVNLMGFKKTPISAVMMAILLGIIIGNIIPLPKYLKPGLTFTVKKVLRLGIIFLGIRLSIVEVLRLGAMGVPIVIICILSALFFCSLLSKWLKLPERLGTLIAVGTSICGVSAIVATGPAIDAKDEEVAYAVAVITIFGILATLLYPYVANVIFQGNIEKIGLFLGTSIHDTSQVTGAALVYADVFSQPRVIDIATVTKLVRNVFMIAVIPFMAVYYSHKTAKNNKSINRITSISKLFPIFILGFLSFAVLRSIGDAGIINGGKAFGLIANAYWTEVCGFIKNWAVNFLVVALASVGLSTNINMFRGLGIKPFIIGLFSALIVGVVNFITISLIVIGK